MHILDQHTAGKGLPGPVSPEESSSHHTRGTVAPHDIVGGESLLLLGLSIPNLDIDPSMIRLLARLDDFMVELDLDQTVTFLHAMSVHDLENLAERKNGHAVRMVLHHRQIDTCQLLAIGHSPPTNAGETGDALLPNVVEDARSTEYLGRRHTVLGGSKPLVQSVPGFQDEGGDFLLRQ